MGFPVSVEHIKQLAMYAVLHDYQDRRFGLIRKYGGGGYSDEDCFLAMDNIANILHRHNMESANLSSEIKEISISEKDILEVRDPVRILKMCDYYELCSLPKTKNREEWFNSEVYWIIYCIRSIATRKLPGYHYLPCDYKIKDDCDICWNFSSCDLCRNDDEKQISRTRRKQ